MNIEVTLFTTTLWCNGSRAHGSSELEIKVSCVKAVEYRLRLCCLCSGKSIC
jgi:hypothetical protein